MKLIEQVIARLVESGFSHELAIDIATKAYSTEPEKYAPGQPRADNGEFGEGSGSGGGSKPSGGRGDTAKPKPSKPRAPKKPKPEAGAAPTISRDNPPQNTAEVDAMLKDTQKEFDAIAAKDPKLASAVSNWAGMDYKAIRAVQQGTYKEPYEGAKARIDGKIAAMDAGFSKLPAYDGAITRELAGVDVSQFKEGGSFKTDAYSSFTAKPSWGLGETPAVRLVVAKNSSGRAIWGMARPEEAEVLVPKGTSYRISKVVPGKPAEVHLEEVHDGKDGADISALVNQAMNAFPSDRARDELKALEIEFSVKRFEELVPQLMATGYDHATAIEIANEVVQIEKDAETARARNGRFASTTEAAYNPDQPRDDHGRFGSGGSGDAPRGPKVSMDEHNAAGESTITDGAIPGTAPWISQNVNGGEGIERPESTVAPSELPASENTNKFADGAYSDYTNSGRFTTMKGSEVTAQDAQAFYRHASKELGNNVAPALARATKEFEKKGINIVSTSVRAKNPESLQTKMNGKWSDKTLDQVTDGIGARFVVRNQKDADLLVAKFKSVTGMTPIEHKDYVANPKDSGYSAEHLLVRTPGGFTAEIQIKTENQNTFAKWAHDSIYKDEKLSKDKSVTEYTAKVGSILRDIDMGKTPSATVPEPPKVLTSSKNEFPWGKVDRKPY